MSEAKDLAAVFDFHQYQHDRRALISVVMGAKRWLTGTLIARF